LENVNGDPTAEALLRLAGGPEPAAAVAGVAGVAGDPAASGPALLDALVVLRWVQGELAAIEPALVEAARAAGVSWQELAPALGVASRQAAERRYLRARATGAGTSGGTRDDRVRAERDRRAGQRAVHRWAGDHTADLRRLAGQVTALTDLGEGAAADVARLDEALAGADASALPDLLGHTRRHLDAYPDLAGHVDDVRHHTDRIRRRTQQQRDGDAGRAPDAGT
jgi:hypothetical protein